MLTSKIDRWLLARTSSGGTPTRCRAILLLVAVAGLGFGGCAQQPQQVRVSHGKEYFPSSVYGPASKRVIADGQPVPRGGGQYLVGKPYMIAGRTYVPTESRATQVGSASWYGDAFHGRLTANGEVYDRDAFTAASPTMPLPSYARVTNLRNNYSMIVRVNDRGPYASDRIMDVSRRVAEALDYKRHGTTKLKVEYVGRASLAGSDDARLYATLRTPEMPETRPTMVAAAAAEDDAPTSRRRPQRRDIAVVPGERYGRDDRLVRRAPDNRRVETAWRQPESEDRREGHASRRRVAEIGGDELRPGWRYSGQAHMQKHASRDETRLPRELPPALTHPRPGEPVQANRRAHGGTEIVRLPPSRPMDLGTIPGAASQIRAQREPARLRLARSRD